MFAAFQHGTDLHIVRWTGRVRLHAGVISYCELQADAAQGVLQVPDGVLTQGVAYSMSGTKLVPCAKCRMAVQASISS